MTTIGISGVEGFARAARELYAAPNETELLRLAVDLDGNSLILGPPTTPGAGLSDPPPTRRLGGWSPDLHVRQRVVTSAAGDHPSAISASQFGLFLPEYPDKPRS